MAIYYTGLCRKWKAGQTILFVHKSHHGDAVVGYGMIEDVYEECELSEEEKRECEEHGWKKAIVFKYVIMFERPLLTRDTFLRDPRFRGRYCHGLQLTKERLDSILGQAESLRLLVHQKS
jgi:hypothetical protein